MTLALTAAQFAALEWGAAALLLVPAAFSFIKLCIARRLESKARRIEDPALQQMEADDARQMASTASLFPLWVMILLGAGLFAQALVLLLKLCCAPVTGA